MSLVELQKWTDSVPNSKSNSKAKVDMSHLIQFEKKFDITPDFGNKINWQEYLNKIYSVVDIAIPATERVIVVETDYLKQFVHLLDQTPPRVLGRFI